MMAILGFVICVLMAALLVREWGRLRPIQLALSPFWYFSFLYIVAFLLRAYLLGEDLVSAQVFAGQIASRHYPAPYLNMAIVFSFVLWCMVYWGRRHTMGIASASGGDFSGQRSLPYKRVLMGMLVLGGLALGSFGLLGDIHSLVFGGTEYQLARKGSGLTWVIPELFIFSVLGVIAWWMVHPDITLRRWDLVFLGVVFAVCALISMELHTRRLIAAVAFAYVVLFAVRHPKYWGLILVSVLATILAAPVLDIMRELFKMIVDGAISDWKLIVASMFDGLLLYKVSGSFEGAGHFAKLLEKASLSQLVFGIDHGVSWLFNSGLAMVPRTLWESKPLAYGGMAEFQWVYPHLFDDGIAGSSVPMSFAVDFSFGFGLPFACVMAYVFGRLLGVMERTFWDGGAHVAQVALALYVYIFVFNWVRGGTVIVQSVELYALPLVLMFGFSSTLRAIFGAASEAVGLGGGDWRGTSRVYFYPHTYLRERQLDTIRFWPEGGGVNPELAGTCQGRNVSREQALGASRVSWKSRIPLVNIKRRPKDVPKDAAVYVWGGMINKGPFITDLDNPYALTGYNVFAARLFKIIIQAFLESPRCLKIRCMSQACLDGMHAEYGDAVAAKCVVAYPRVAPAVERAKAQDAAKCRFLFVSSQFEIKGGAPLLNAFARVVADFPEAELDVITHLPNRFAEQAAHIPNLRIHDSDLTREEVGARFMSNADVLIHPTYMDSFGMVILEGLAHGLPVIATDVYAIREMVEDGRNGCLLPAPISSWSGVKPSTIFSDVEKTRALAHTMDMTAFENALTEAMTKMVQNPDFRAMASARSLELVRTRFSPTS